MDNNLFGEFAPVTAKQWESAITQELKGKSFESLTWITEEGFKLRPFYALNDINEIKIPNLKRHEKGWRIVENIAVTDIRSANEKARQALRLGSNSLHFIIKNKISKADLQNLLKEIPLQDIATNLSCSDPSALIKWFKEVLSSYDLSINKLRGSVTLLNDENKSSEIPSIDFLKNFTDLPAGFLAIKIFSSNRLITHQLAEALSQAEVVLKHFTNEKLNIGEVAGRIGFSLTVSENYFFEIAKIRALRILWKDLLKSFDCLNEKSGITFIHAAILPETGVEKNNQFISNTSRIMAAAIGGADSISISSPDEFSENVNRNIQLIAKEESYLNQAGDASAGSYYIEHLTRQLVEETQKILKEEKQ